MKVQEIFCPSYDSVCCLGLPTWTEASVILLCSFSLMEYLILLVSVTASQQIIAIRRYFLLSSSVSFFPSFHLHSITFPKVETECFGRSWLWQDAFVSFLFLDFSRNQWSPDFWSCSVVMMYHPCIYWDQAGSNLLVVVLFSFAYAESHFTVCVLRSCLPSNLLTFNYFLKRSSRC